MAERTRGGEGPEDLEAAESCLSVQDVGKRVQKLRILLQNVVGERAYIQADRDLVEQMFRVTCKEVKQLEAANVVKDRDMLNYQSHHSVELAVYHQKTQQREFKQKADLALAKESIAKAMQVLREQHKL
eukprot:GHVQ01012674.1.p1 GENE.GHVQ01012674.1~~GHVQ01012674.1.p1  ORF type:complete len:129 (+),score=30.00 GHVQ01012674.1:547-933(+)